MKVKTIFFIWERLEEVCREHNKAAWSAYGLGLLVVLLAFSLILQPTAPSLYKPSGVRNKNKTHQMQLDFANSTVGQDPALEAQFTVKTLPEVTWGLGFDIRDGKNRGAYVWLYHDVVAAETEQIYLRLWVTCIKEKKDPIYLENPWNGSTWKPVQDNDLTIKVTQNQILLQTGVNDTQEETDCSLSTDFSQIKLQLECWALEGQCPEVTQQGKEDSSLIILTVILNVASFACMGIVLGIGLSLLWVRFININLYQMAWWTTRKKMNSRQ